MLTESTIEGIVDKLKNSECRIEEDVSYKIIQPICKELGWDVDKKDVCTSQYIITGKSERVDFALLNKNKKPIVFIESKKPGNIKKEYVDQIWNYAKNENVEFAILTDGQIWQFFFLSPHRYRELERLPFKELDLYKDTPQHCVEILIKYLEHERVTSHLAISAVRQDYDIKLDKLKAIKQIPYSVKTLIEEENKQIIEIISNKIMSDIKIDPKKEPEELKKSIAQHLKKIIGIYDECEKSLGPDCSAASIKNYLKNNKQVSSSNIPEKNNIPPNKTEEENISEQNIASNPTKTTAKKELPENNTATTGIHCVIFKGKTKYFEKGTSAFVHIFKELAKIDPDFLEKFHASRYNDTGIRRYIGKTREEIYKKNPENKDFTTEKICDGWLLQTHSNTSQKQKIVKLVSEKIAGLKYSEDGDIFWVKNKGK